VKANSALLGGRDTVPRDDFILDDPSYSINEFYTDSTDKRGHSAQVRVRVPPNVSRRVAEIVQQRRFPKLKTCQDFYRDAIAHRLYQLEKMIDPTGQSDALEMIAIQSRAQEVIDQLQQVQQTIDKAEAAVNELLRVGSPEEARVIVRSIMEHVPEYLPAKRLYERLMREKFGAMISDIAADADGTRADGTRTDDTQTDPEKDGGA
jgi:hypothetical protein